MEHLHIEVLEKEIYDMTPIIETPPSTDFVDENQETQADNVFKQSLLQADFSELKKRNADTKGWISVMGTTIHYPFVQTSNNEFYLNHSFDQKRNGAGWIFLDYRNHLEETNRNLILYAHGGSKQALFGDLKNTLTTEWFSNPQNFMIKMSTEYENSMWEIFSVYEVPTTSDYLQIHFSSENEFQDFLTHLKNRSVHDFSTSILNTNSILTLSTCSSDTDKVVLHAKLIKRERRI